MYGPNENDHMKNHPNILIVVTDQLRRDGLRCYGDPVTLTPNLDRLAGEGVRFTNCISNHPVCSPWRATFQTGQYAHVHGVFQNNLPIDTKRVSLADCFNRAGYHTAYYGKSHWSDCGKPGFVPENFRMGYREWWGFNCGHFHWDAPDFDLRGELTHQYAGRYEPEVQTTRAIEFLQRSHDRPWMLQLNWGPPHNATMDAEYDDPVNRGRMKRVNDRRGFGIDEEIMDSCRPTDPPVVSHFPQHLAGRLLPETYLGLYGENDFPARPDIPKHDVVLTNSMRREYSAMTTSIDDQMGRLLQALEETGLAENTILVFTSDHGDHLGAHGRRRGKGTHLQSAWRTPLLIRGPGCGAGGLCESLVAGIDLFPTLCSMAGVACDRAAPFGRDVSDCFLRNAPSQESVLVGLKDWRCLVTAEWAYAVTWEDTTPRPLHLIRHTEDPFDLNDLQDAEPDVCKHCHQLLLDKMKEAKDPLLE
jgi:arylsulfatase A-like enzyme